MTWDAFHHRGDVLRAVVDEANRRRDGVLPTDLPGSPRPSATSSRWSPPCSCAGTPGWPALVERALGRRTPATSETAVVAAWRRTAASVAGRRCARSLRRAAPSRPSSPEEAAARSRDRRGQGPGADSRRWPGLADVRATDRGPGRPATGGAARAARPGRALSTRRQPEPVAGGPSGHDRCARGYRSTEHLLLDHGPARAAGRRLRRSAG